MTHCSLEFRLTRQAAAHIRTAFIALFCLLAVTRGAVASTITLEFMGEGQRGIVGIHSAGLGNVTVYAGELLWKLQGTSNVFYTYCVDANNWALYTQTVEQKPASQLATTAADGGAKAAWLVNNFAPGIHSSMSATAGIQAAGLQVAIWEALYDNAPNLNLNSGAFYLLGNTPAAIRTAALEYLDALFYAGLSNTATYRTANGLFYDAPLGMGQDQMAPVPNPEPASLVLLGTGLAAAAAARRRKRRSE
ncbi:MAG: VPLPA-CTERM sorting domain-containing protein [Vicinamibacterales bacterium]